MGKMSCGCYALILLFNAVVGGIAVNFLIEFFTGAPIPFFWAGVIGLITGEITVPVAIVVLILSTLKVISPAA